MTRPKTSPARQTSRPPSNRRSPEMDPRKVALERSGSTRRASLPWWAVPSSAARDDEAENRRERSAAPRTAYGRRRAFMGTFFLRFSGRELLPVLQDEESVVG